MMIIHWIILQKDRLMMFQEVLESGGIEYIYSSYKFQSNRRSWKIQICSWYTTWWVMECLFDTDVVLDVKNINLVIQKLKSIFTYVLSPRLKLEFVADTTNNSDFQRNKYGYWKVFEYYQPCVNFACLIGLTRY